MSKPGGSPPASRLHPEAGVRRAEDAHLGGERWNGTSAGYITAPSTPAGRNGILINRSTVNGDVAASSFHLGRNRQPGGDKTADPQAAVRNSNLCAAITRTPSTDMGGFALKNDR